MISIIVSSYRPSNYTAFCNSVKKTIGVDYEIIKIDNPGLMGTSAAYNLGANIAKFPILCFSHEDIIFHTMNWGRNILKEFNDDLKIGIIGAAGGSYKAYIPSGWFSSFNKKLNYINVDYFDNQHSKIQMHNIGLPYQEVITVDGCFIATRYEIWNSHNFDEITFIKHHCYDLDFCLNVGLSYKLVVPSYMFIQHRSHGNFNAEWLFETYKLHKKWNNSLPRYININKQDIKTLEMEEFITLSNSTFQIQSNIFKILKILFSIKTLKLFGLKNWLIAIFNTLNKLKFLILENRQAL